MNVSKAVLVGFAAVGAAVGAFAVASATTSGSTSTSDNGDTSTQTITDPPEPIVFAATTGRERKAFEFSLTEAQRDAVVSVTSADERQVCITVSLPDGGTITDSCADAGTVSTGLAFGLAGETDGGYTVYGVVPDEVDSVEVGGSSVVVTGNVWSTHLNSAAPVSLRVGNSKSGVWVELPPASEG